MKQVKRITAVLLALTVIMLAACSDFGTAVKAAEIGGGNDVNLDCYGEYISNDELGELISYGGYISKSEYARHINDDSVGASYTPSFEGCYDTGGNQIYVRRAMAKFILTSRFIKNPAFSNAGSRTGYSGRPQTV